MPLSAEGRAEWLAVMNRHRELVHLSIRLAAEPGGVVLAQQRRHDGSPMGAMVSMDPSGKWRMTRFDEDGFSGHVLFEDKRRAVMDALTEGYRDTDRDLLRQLSKTPRFRAHIWEH